MYRLIRVQDSFQVVEGGKSEAALPAVAHANPFSFYDASSRYWSSCSHVEKQSWKKFLKTGSVNSTEVRRTILDSWERCRNSHIEFNPQCVDLLSGKDLENRRGLLWEISEPIMETLHQCVRGSGYLIVLAGSDGRVLESLGDLASLKQAEKLYFGPGANWSEMSVGTNAIGTALTLGIPMQVTGVEHYCETHHVWTCSATPIRSPEGSIIGCLDISGPREMAHFHTLGMTVAAVRAIEEAAPPGTVARILHGREQEPFDRSEFGVRGADHGGRPGVDHGHQRGRGEAPEYAVDGLDRQAGRGDRPDGRQTAGVRRIGSRIRGRGTAAEIGKGTGALHRFRQPDHRRGSFQEGRGPHVY